MATLIANSNIGSTQVLSLKDYRCESSRLPLAEQSQDFDTRYWERKSHSEKKMLKSYNRLIAL